MPSRHREIILIDDNDDDEEVDAVMPDIQEFKNETDNKLVILREVVASEDGQRASPDMSATDTTPRSSSSSMKSPNSSNSHSTNTSLVTNSPRTTFDVPSSNPCDISDRESESTTMTGNASLGQPHSLSPSLSPLSGSVRGLFDLKSASPTSQLQDSTRSNSRVLRSSRNVSNTGQFEDDHESRVDESQEVFARQRFGAYAEQSAYDPNQDFIEIFDDSSSDEDTPPPPIPNDRKRSVMPPPRNPPIDKPYIELPYHKLNQGRLAPGIYVELANGDFLRIKHIVRNTQSNEVKLRGHQLQRCKNMNGLLEKKLNELCYYFEVDLDDPRPALQQSVVEVPLEDFRKFRSVTPTNQKFPRDRNMVREDFKTQEEAAANGGLTVRWKYTCKYATARERKKNKHTERILERFRADEIDATVSDKMRRVEWRGETILGGAYIGPQEIVREEEPHQASGTRDDSPISIGSSPEPDPEVIVIPSRSPSPEAQVVPRRAGKRKRALSESSSTTIAVKRPRIASHGIEVATQGVQRMSMDDDRDGIASSASDVRATIEHPSCPILDQMSSHHSRKHISERIHPKQCPRRCHLPEASSSQSSGEALDEPLREQGDVQSTGSSLVIKKQYTYGDAFCGSGGSTRGAFEAGLHVKWGFDMWDTACQTWRANFPSAQNYQVWADEFVEMARLAAARGQDLMKVDILHLSPPCQYFSPAHTVPGPNDEQNVASLFAVRSLIEVVRPRVATLEQTFGMTSPQKKLYLASLIHMFTSLDYSVRWAVIPMAQWGLPQRRKRLILIASCPGELLPHFPPPTHAADGIDGLKPFKTVNQTIANIARTPLAHLHRPDFERWKVSGRREPPWDGNAILPRSMTCHGGLNFHPNGERDFTIAEYAVLQGFPTHHRFGDMSIKRQIGNAVPPSIARILFASIKRELEKADGVDDAAEGL